VENLTRRRLLLFRRQRIVAGAKDDGLTGQLFYTAARADGLIVDLDVRMQLVVLREPLRVDRVREGGTGPGNLDLLGRQRHTNGGNGGNRQYCREAYT
jgi:hypothetical protein